MSELAEKAEAAGLKVMVFKHHREAQHFRLVLFKEDLLTSLDKALPDLKGLSDQQSEKLSRLKAALNDETFPSEMSALAPFQNLEVPNSELEVYLKYLFIHLPQTFALSAALTENFDDP